MSSDKIIRIGCYSAFWGDSITAAEQLVPEVTMGILARRRQQQQQLANKSKSVQDNDKKVIPRGGYVEEFITFVIRRLLPQCIEHNTTIITNAGGLDPVACKEAIEAAMQEMDIPSPPKVAAIYGDDLLERSDIQEALQPLAHIQHTESTGDTGEDILPKQLSENTRVVSLNAYTGAWPIVEALRGGARIIVTGRAADSALVLAPLAYEFNWQPTNDWDRLAAGSLAGHIIECGCQATGGNFTDWKLSARSGHGGWANMGYPIIECREDGSFIVTKPSRTGGIVSVGSVGEQMVYEVLDPGAYLLPDVVIDLRLVTLHQQGKDRVEVRGVRGRAPTPWIKVSGVYMDGYKMSGELVIGGLQAREKALAVGDAVLRRSRAILKQLGLDDFRQSNMEVIGSEHTYGPHSRVNNSREVILRVVVVHDNVQALRVFGMEMAPVICYVYGTWYYGSGSGRPHPQPQLTHFASLVPRNLITCQVAIDQQPIVACHFHSDTHADAAVPPALPAEIVPHQLSPDSPDGRHQSTVQVPLIRLCYGRSGDKGDTSNIGLIARHPDIYPILLREVTAASVKHYMSHLCRGDVFRFELPGIYALNFVLTRSLGGGGLSSLNIDRQGKTYAQMLLSMPIAVPRSLLAHI
ncbi:hypothetical protein BDF22DRAFT_666781 [Syncephalis plumigaleata]|nr:hypothetical protein BDF22DRAFT_666781 [Syncephalis plumigaleata]